MNPKLQLAINRLRDFKPTPPRVTKTIFGEVVCADPKTCAQNSRELANLAFNFFKELSLSENKDETK